MAAAERGEPGLEVADAILLEGHRLYPYYEDAPKNTRRWTFGGLFPDPPGPASQWTEVVVEGTDAAQIGVTARFMQRDELRLVMAGPIDLAELQSGAHVVEQHLPGGLTAAVELSARPVQAGVWVVRAEVTNGSELPADVAPADALRGVEGQVPWIMGATHMILEVAGGVFVSAIAPPADRADIVASTSHQGVWPVLMGPVGTLSTILAAPVILQDHPRIAPESIGDWCDATEIDEMLCLRMQTLAPAERAAIEHGGDARAKAILARADAVDRSEQRGLHGTFRHPPTIGVGARVELRAPASGGAPDVMDWALFGRTATVIEVREDVDGGAWALIVFEDDPGRDLGVEGMPGHRFFFRPDELEVVG